MKTSKRAALTVLLAVTCASAGDLLAQRRTTGSSGSDGRRAPSGSGGTTRSSGGSRSGGSSRPTASPSRGSGSGSQPSTRATDDRPSSGKIAAVRREARAARSTGSVYVDRRLYIDSCWNCDYWGWYGGGWGWYHRGWWYPSRYPYPYEPPREYDDEDEEADVGQGYLAYPYATARGSGATFVQSRTRTRRSYGAVSGQFFSDVGSTTQAGRFALEGAYRALRGEFEFGHYEEPVAGGTSRLQTWRVGIGGQPRLGDRAYLIAGIAARGVLLDDGNEAGGPEGELGIQVFPARPLGLGVTGRVAALTWDRTDYFTLREVNSTASVFVGRVEIQAGWHFLKIGGSPAFAGPVAGMRLWF